MATIELKEDTKITPYGTMSMPGWFVPSMRIHVAIAKGKQKKWLMYVVGGLGDAICAEPSIRYGFDNFGKDVEISIATWFPEIYSHLPAKEIISFHEFSKPMEYFFDEYLVFKTLWSGDHLHSEFIPHFFTQVIDYHTLTMWRQQLAPHQKKIVLKPTAILDPEIYYGHLENSVILHPGRTWQSRTIPSYWWDELIQELLHLKLRPVIIGATTKDPKLGTVELNTEGCLDLRNKLSIMESVDLLQKARVLITNDSSPLHMAATGNAWIGMLSTVKRPDLLFHWRGPDNELGWRMENLTTGGMWDIMDMSPLFAHDYNIAEVDPELLKSWLPRADSVALWCDSRIAVATPQ